MLEVIDALDTELPQEKLVRRLRTILNSYLEPAQVADCMRAYHYSDTAHSGQVRKSGEAYICHPISVALYLAELRMDANGIMAAILHDVIEDTLVSKKELSEAFNKEVADLVDGVTKLTLLNDTSRAEAQAENVRKMFLAMAKDLRVIIVKLADRLHNMQTLGVMPSDKKRRIAKETLDIYAPIAHRLGMNEIRHQLESLGFAAMFPLRYRVLKNAVKKVNGNRRELVNTIENTIRTRLLQSNLACEVSGREKNLYSIYRKMLTKKTSFSDVFDIYAFRVFCNDEDSCYRILGIVHNLFKPIPGRFKDYIALPKTNGYQSLHTVLIGPYGVPVEIQIRTHAMHRMSESGIAAHWLYKSDDQSTTFQDRANEWLRDMVEMQKAGGDSMEFIDNLKIDLFPQEVFVFTPQGAIIKLPRGATIVDFAYTVHTDIGSSCVSARIDKQLVPLQTQLENGMTVEVITASWARPNPLWLNYVVTAKARTRIRAYLKNFHQQDAINLGQRLLEKELSATSINIQDIAPDRLKSLLKVTNMQSLDQLLENIGLGNKMPFLIAKLLNQDDIHAAIKLDDSEKAHNSPLIIKGTEGMVVTLAKCCHPIPGDHVIGLFNPGRGIVVHYHECRNRNEIRKKPTNWLDIEWSAETRGEFTAEIRIELLNQRGTLATIASTISKQESNIENVSIIHQDDRVSIDLIALTVRDRVHLAKIMRQLKQLSIVLKITRVKA
ncbi:MAG: RelA/SpoT family protein [Methylococcales bacterium]|nr:RelA/SpoT family protein [Methylococcales bacterium]